MSRPASLVAAQMVATARSYLSQADLLGLKLSCFAQDLNLPETTVAGRLQMAGSSWMRLKQAERDRRLNTAMTEEGILHADDLAEYLGFPDTQSFYRFFKHSTGSTFTDERLRRQAI